MPASTEADPGFDSDAMRRSLLEGISEAGVGVIVTDGRRVLDVNDAFVRMIGRPRAQLVGLDTTLLVVPEERPQGAARQDARLRERQPQSFRCHFLRGDGTRFPGQVIGRPLRSEPPRFVALVRDLTEEERARAEVDAARRHVAQSEKLSALGSLVSGVAHEVRTPLAYLQTTLHVLQRRLDRATARPGADPALRELSSELLTTLEAADRIERLVDDLRRFTRLRAGAPRLVPVDEAARQGVELFRATHRAADVRTQIAATPHARADELSVQQVVLNLLSNALDASPPERPVHVRVLPTEEGALLEVADEGAGIAPEVLPRIFDPFYTTKQHGTGLGLSIVQRLAQDAGASVEVESAEGKGTLFRVRFPGERQGI